MAKVKIVQIAYKGPDDVTEYVDDKGRVWYEAGHYEKEPGTALSIYVSDGWKQLDMPDEPEDTDASK